MDMHKNTILATIIFLLLAQALLPAGSVTNEPLQETIIYIKNSSDRLDIAYISKPGISGELRSPMGFGESGGLKQRIESYIIMNTFKDRLYHSQDAIVALSKSFQGKCIVYDVGPGWALGNLGPITAVDLAKALSSRANVYGIEKQKPYYALYVKDNTVVLFDQYDEIIFVNSFESGSMTGDMFKELDSVRHETYISFAKLLKRAALARGQKTASVSIAGENLTYAIAFDPISGYESENLRFINADLFNLGDIRNTIPKAHIVRIENLLMVHYDAAYIKQALESLADVTDDGAYVLIGLSDSDRFAFGYNEEECLVYRKKGSEFVLTDFMFSVDSEKVSFGLTSSVNIKPPLRGLQSSFIGLIKDSEKADSILNKIRRQNEYVPGGGDKIDRIRELETEIAQVSADELIKRGIETSSYGNMVAINLDSLRNTTDELGVRIKENFQASYINIGVPLSVSLNKAESALRETVGISNFRTVRDDI